MYEITEENKYNEIIEEAIEIFYENYIFQIHKLIDEYPKDKKNKDGGIVLSWSKWFPEIINFNIKNKDCFNFSNRLIIIIKKIGHIL